MVNLHAIAVAATAVSMVGLASADLCSDYSASVCSDAFTDCDTILATIPAGDADPTNDASEAGTQTCMAYHLTAVDGASSVHCAHARGEGPCAPQFCQDYAATACSDAFTDCTSAYSAMPAGDADASNDASEAGTKACVAKHLTLVDGASSAHCAHARGEGPCTPTHCQNYAASACSDAFTDCDTILATIPAGDADPTNDASEAGTQTCMAYHLTAVDGASSVHCAHARGEGPCAPQFCQDYAATACSDAFTDCTSAYSAMPAGDADASNDASEAGTKACVAKHLTLVDGASSAHCAHARGEGPCAVPASAGPAVKSSATSTVAAAAGVACALCTMLF